MTIQAALQAEITPYTATETLLGKVLTDHGFDGELTYAATDKAAVAECAIDLLGRYLALKSENEGAMSQQYDVNGLRARIRQIAADNGLEETVTANHSPGVRDKSHRW